MYQVLYRKYRPKVFADVYGQEHITATLQNEIQNGRIAHAYLFTGSRGTGKTTCAKILAKAVNCENSQHGEPCNECEVCKGLESGAIYDVVEIDAASNNGVDNIRDLREEAVYTPSRAAYRVYIIDEVHMLSAGAFNALLKTLEEPPAHVIFILATTEVHKLPATILSRCQRFDFKRIQPETMAVRLQQVAQQEQITLEDDAAILIARIADGALRDGLSVLDQCAGRNKHVTSALVSEVAGLAGREALYALSACIADKNAEAAMNQISDLYQNSYDMERLCVEMIHHFRNYLLVKTVKKNRELIICTDDEYQQILQGVQLFTLEGILFALDLFQETLVTIKGGAAARIEVEMALIKLCEPRLEKSTAALLQRLSALENALKNGNIPARIPASASAPVIQEHTVDAPPAEEEDTSLLDAASVAQVEAPAIPAEATVQEPATLPDEVPPVESPAEAPAAEVQLPFEQWGEFMDALHQEDITLFGILNGAGGFIKGDFFLIDSPNATIGDFLKKSNSARTIKKVLFDLTGKKFRLGLVNHADNADKPKRDPLEDLIAQAQTQIQVDIK